MPRSVESFHRQQEVFLATTRTSHLTMIGVGGIGSTAALILARMGVGQTLGTDGRTQIDLWDGDVVETHNVPSQWYSDTDSGTLKVEALSSLIRAQLGISPNPIPRMWNGEPLSGLVVAGLDSMAARQKLWFEGVKYHADIPLFIDGRMGAEMGLVYAVRPTDLDDVRFYEAELNSDEEAPSLPCTARAIIYNTSMLGALIGSIVKKWARGQPFPREIVCDLGSPEYMLLTREIRV